MSASIVVERVARDGFARTARLKVGAKALATPAVVALDAPFAPAAKDAAATLFSGGANGHGGLTFAWGPSPLFGGHPPKADVLLPRLVPRGYTVAPLMDTADLAREEAHVASGLPSREGSAHFAAFAKSADVVAVQNLNELRGKPREFVRALTGARSAVGPRPILFAPGVADPASLALLTYLGADLFDDFQAIAAATAGVFLYNFGSIAGGLPGGCHCAACLRLFGTFVSAPDAPRDERGLADEGERGAELGEGRGSLADRNLRAIARDDPLFGAALEHNRLALSAEARVAARAIENGTLREFVEARVRAHPWLVAALRNFDREFGVHAQRLTPAWKTRLHALSHESLHRPEVERWVARMKERYAPPPSVRVLLLVPCSARKPYSLSKTQHTISRALAGIRPGFAIHRAVVTSPLGLVPGELERVFPAAHYDIPVTGDWTAEEADRVFDQVAHLANAHAYRKVVSLVGDDLPNLKEQVAGVVECAAKGTPWEQSLAAAAEAVREALNGERDVDPKRRTLEDLQSVARFQFGKAAGDALFAGAVAKGKYPWNRVFAGKVQLAQHVPNRGRLSLTIQGAERTAAAGAYRVTVGDFELKGDVFAVGVTAADPEIQEGDAVSVVRGGKVIAAGFARMSADEMLAMRRGSAVDVRHKGG